MKGFKSRYGKLPGTSYGELMHAARKEYQLIQKRTPRRQAYIRSKYFSRDKIFVGTFWEHLSQKRSSDQARRLAFFACAVDLLRNTTSAPETITSRDDRNHLLHRFLGVSKNNEPFAVQVKENKRTGRKDFMSVFPLIDHK